ncbi:MAG: CHAT domain-containing protein [Acidobacteria bacterium]|nr:CHAT domain-containing protein [Acidobacteriota bacterium]
MTHKYDPNMAVQNRTLPRQSPTARYLLVGVIVIVSCTAVWRIGLYRSNIETGLAELQGSISDSRPIEVRIADFDHAPWTAIRGNPNLEQKDARDRAERLLVAAAGEQDDATSLAALGKFYLAERKFEKANDLFERAASKEKEAAVIHADWGASLLELGKFTRDSGDRARSVELFDQALGRFEEALDRSPKMLEARFNLALCLEALYLSDGSRKAWSDYLSLDSSSKWAEEARQRFARFDTSFVELKPEKLREDFLSAASSGDRDAAWSLLSKNRELIAQKYLPQNLAMAFVDADPAERSQLLNALDLAGMLEAENTNDTFASNIARYYRGRNVTEIAMLREAQAAVKNGYRSCLELKYSECLTEFNRAEMIFGQVGNIWEANLSAYFVGYCRINLGDGFAGIEILGKVVEYAKKNKFKWLEMTALYWNAGAKRLIKLQAESNVLYRRALVIAENIGDDYAIQRNLFDLSFNSSFLGQYSEAFAYMQRAAALSFPSGSSMRQRYRNANFASQTYSSAGLNSCAKAAAVEAVTLADSLNDLMFKANSRGTASITFLRSGENETARKYIDESLDTAANIGDEKTRNKVTAIAQIRAASIAEQTGDLAESIRLLREADEALDVEAISHYQYQAKKGLLYGLNSAGEKEELDRRLPQTIALIEEYRGNIELEKERTSFFDNGVTIYDIAVESEFEKGDLAAAFNYTERSTSRSLVDRMRSHENTAFPASISGPGPFTIDQIRERMNASSQIVRFSVLEKKLLIWIISKDKFSVVPVTISAAELRSKVENYVRLVKRGIPADGGAISSSGQELYRLLIEPVSDQLDASLETCVIPSKFLYYLPFAALADLSGEPLVKTYSIGYAPSATIFVLASADAAVRPRSQTESLLAVGNPAFSPTDFADLPNLPSAEIEVKTIAGNYRKPTILMNEAAKKETFVREISSADIIHFAGHYVVAERDPDSSYMLLASNGKSASESILTNEELEKIRLTRTKLVVLAACDSGLENYFDGEGLVGLSRTFLASGVPVVVASQWSVDSDASAELMKRFHIHRRSNRMSTPRALRAAQLELATEQNGRFTNPYYWAAFAVFGGNSSY